MKKICFIITLIMVMQSIVFADLSELYNDVPSGHWAYSAISYMYSKGTVVGYLDHTFKPDNPITRAEFAKILVSALKLKSGTDDVIFFDDVPSDHWAYDYVITASKYLSPYPNGKYNYSYKPDEKAIREDVAVAIVIAAGYENKSYDLLTLDKFGDKDEISEGAKKYVAIAVENELMRGHDDGKFEPRGILTRAQVCQLFKNINDKKTKAVSNLNKDSNYKVSQDKPVSLEYLGMTDSGKQCKVKLHCIKTVVGCTAKVDDSDYGYSIKLTPGYGSLEVYNPDISPDKYLPDVEHTIHFKITDVKGNIYEADVKYILGSDGIMKEWKEV